MIKAEVIEKMMNSENAPVIAGIGGIVLLVGIDRITRSHYRIEGKKDSFTLEPVNEQAPAKEETAPAKKNSK